ncbi:hypothetical protein CBER1_07967 [Cercospora berteroae]|uniref:F-box domain-containing protein n=1 Tax=Cercospora berteroae TaxID=357750 RepID=A0A2S6BVJ8_9PEZI|nr:hypothetical protein CBER1_07967 [Cercospora berteroae]
MENSPLEKLPAELRNEIYRLAVSANKPLNVCARSPGYHKAVQPPITRVCRQIRGESLGIFYHCNDLVFKVVSAECWDDGADNIGDRMDEIELWLKCTRKKNRAAIRNLQIVCGSNFRPPNYDSEWQFLKGMLLEHGYGEKEKRKNILKCSIHVHLVFNYWARKAAILLGGLSIEAYRAKQELHSRKPFEDSGFNVQVTSEQVHNA